jgi:hypothetical protein
MLREVGLPSGAPLSVLCVEMLPGLAAQRVSADSRPGIAASDLVAAVHAERSGTSVSGAAPASDGARPLSDALGHFRILRASPLTPVPPVC